MVVNFSATARHLLRQAQRACCHTRYAPATVPLDREQVVAAIAEDLDLDEATVCCYAQVYRTKSLAGYLATERPGCRGLLTSTQLAGLNQELGQTLYTDCRTIADWPVTSHGVRYSVSGLTDLLHRLDANALGALSYHLTTTAPRQADAGQQTAFLTDTLVPLLAQAEAREAMVCFVDAAHPTHNTRATRAWTETGEKRPLLTVSGRERVNRNAALNTHASTQVHLDEIDCVNAQSTQRRYGKLLTAHPEGPV